MEDQEYEHPMNASLRKQALEKALQLYSQFDVTRAPDGETLLHGVIYIADKFYTFLKGETK